MGREQPALFPRAPSVSSTVQRWMVSAVLAVLGLLTTLHVGAQPQQPATTSTQSLSLTDPVPVDPEATIGTLPNGLRYYIRFDATFPKRAELRLVIKAGSVLEDDDQLGMASFLVRMAASGTTHFSKQDIGDFMQSISTESITGMNTRQLSENKASFDETVYELQPPTDKPDVIERAFLLLGDWAHNLSFDPVDVERERGAAIRDFDARASQAARLLASYRGSRYAERPPFGKKETLQGFLPERLKRFYSDWYRPDLMAVIAVGNFDEPAVEALIKKHFGAIPVAMPLLRPEYTVPDLPGTRFEIYEDQWGPDSEFEDVYEKAVRRETSTVGGYRDHIVADLAGRMLSARLSEIGRKSDLPWLLFVGPQWLGSSKVEFKIRAMTRTDLVESALESLLTETTRVARFGFTPNELERMKHSILADKAKEDSMYSRMAAALPHGPAGLLAEKYQQHFTQQRPAPGPAAETELYQRFLPGITLNDVDSVAKDWTSESKRVVVSVRRMEGVAIPDEAKLAALVRKVDGKELKPYVDSIDAEYLMIPPSGQSAAARQLLDRFNAAANESPGPNASSEATLADTASWLQQFSTQSGTVARTTTKEAFGITEWELSNGVRVVLKPTALKDDEIVVRAFSPGGTSLANEKDFLAAKVADRVVSAGGLGRFDAGDLKKFLTGKTVSVRAFINETDEGLTGSSSRKDLATMFQFIHLAFTQPRADSADLKSIISDFDNPAARVVNASPGLILRDVLQRTVTQDHVLARPLTQEMVRQVGVDKALGFYKDRFADASDFTFVFVGDFDLPNLQPLVERYLGGLPSLHRHESWKDVGIRSPKGVVEDTIELRDSRESRMAVAFTGPFEFDPLHRVEIRSLALVLQTRLRNWLRGSVEPPSVGGVVPSYSGSVTASYWKVPQEVYRLTIDFGCLPERLEGFVKNLFHEIDQLKAEGPSEKEVTDVNATLARAFQTSIQGNAYLAGQIAFEYQNGEDLTNVFGIGDLHNKLTRADIHAAARRYFDLNNYVKVTLVPERRGP